MTSKKQRPDGRPRFPKDTGYIALALQFGKDPDDPKFRPAFISSMIAAGKSRAEAEQEADEFIADLRWGKAGFPTV